MIVPRRYQKSVRTRQIIQLLRRFWRFLIWAFWVKSGTIFAPKVISFEY